MQSTEIVLADLAQTFGGPGMDEDGCDDPFLKVVRNLSSSSLLWLVMCVFGTLEAFEYYREMGESRKVLVV